MSVGRLTQLLRPNGTKQTRTYDNAGQLSQLRELAPDGTTVLYSGDHTYDLAGQLTGETILPALAAAIVSTTQTFDADNRLLTHNGAATTFDADGNLLSVASGLSPSAYTYDVRNRLISSGGLSYGYNAENRRVSTTDGTGTTLYVVNPNAVPDQVLVKTAPGGTKTFYVYGLGLLHEETGGTPRYYHFDRRGDTVALTDNVGAVTGRVAYGVYGEILSQTGTIATPFLFNGKWGVQTDSNGLYHHRARYYHLALRRFLNQDIVLGDIGDSASMNRFACANGNPVSLIDPFGLMAQDSGYWNQVGWNISFFSYGVLKGLFYDLPVGAYDLANLATNQGAQAELAAALYSLATDASAREAAMNGIIDSWSTQENAMMNLGRLGGQIIGAKGLSELSVLRTAQAVERMPHKNSLDYVGETHVYRVKGPNGTTYKIGESAQGVRVGDGASIRAEQQARRLTRETGDVYTTEIRKSFPDKASAREYETKLIERFRRLYGEDTLPGNKTNR